MQHNRDDQWPVEIFRWIQETSRWEKARTSRLLTVCPRQNAIVFPSIKYRVKMDATSCVAVVRRHSRVSVASSRPHKPTTRITLQFQSDEDCIAFCDQLVQFNAADDNDDESVSSNSLDDEDKSDMIAGYRRILLDAGFEEFVDFLEQELESFPDGQVLLDHLVEGTRQQQPYDDG